MSKEPPQTNSLSSIKDFQKTERFNGEKTKNRSFSSENNAEEKTDEDNRKDPMDEEGEVYPLHTLFFSRSLTIPNKG